jgi:hypothetical protein
VTSPVVVALNGKLTLRSDGTHIGWVSQWGRKDWRIDLRDGFQSTRSPTMRAAVGLVEARLNALSASAEQPELP